MMEVARSVGLAARFVSGYLYDPAIDGGRADTVGAGIVDDPSMDSPPPVETEP